MVDQPFSVGEHVLALRESERLEARVVDAYELPLNGESLPMVVVEFSHGDRAWLVAAEPNVVPLPTVQARAEMAAAVTVA